MILFFKSVHRINRKFLQNKKLMYKNNSENKKYTTKKENMFSSNNSMRYYMHYRNHIAYDFIYKQNSKNVFHVPKIEKIVLNMTQKDIVNDRKHVIPAMSALEIISGQKLIATFAHKSISVFKVRKKQTMGCKVDLRKMQMFHFFEKLVTVILPRVRAFTGIQKNHVDSYNHVNIGLINIVSFPELENYFEYFSNIKKVDITIVIQSKNKKNWKLQMVSTMSGFQIPIK